MSESKLPYQPEAELGIIGCCIVGGIDTTLDAMGLVRSEMFGRDDCGLSWEILVKMADAGSQIDFVRFCGEWKKRHADNVSADVLAAPNNIPSASNLGYYAEQLTEAFRRRRIIFAGQDLMSKGADWSVSVDSLVADVETLLTSAENNYIKPMDAKDCCIRLINHLQERFESKGALPGIATGFKKLDQMIGGIMPSEFTVVAARPSIGKTALGLNIVDYACLTCSVPTLVVSLEMTAHALLRRLLSARQRITMKALRSGIFTEREFAKFTVFQGQVRKAPLRVVEHLNGLNTAELRSIVARETRQYGTKLVMLDYLQKMKSAKQYEKRTYEVGEVAETCKAIATNNGVAMLAMAQLNREPEKQTNKQGGSRLPRLSDLADSSQIEKEGDTVCLLHRERGASETLLIVAKQRDGEVGGVKLDFDGLFCQFRDATFESSGQGDSDTEAVKVGANREE